MERPKDEIQKKKKLRKAVNKDRKNVEDKRWRLGTGCSFK